MKKALKELIENAEETIKSAYEKGYSDGRSARDAEIVRCKECRYWKTETEPIGIECEPGEDAHYCDMDGMITRTADFCSYGRRK